MAPFASLAASVPLRPLPRGALGFVLGRPVLQRNMPPLGDLLGARHTLIRGWNFEVRGTQRAAWCAKPFRHARNLGKARRFKSPDKAIISARSHQCRGGL